MNYRILENLPSQFLHIIPRMLGGISGKVPTKDAKHHYIVSYFVQKQLGKNVISFLYL